MKNGNSTVKGEICSGNTDDQIFTVPTNEDELSQIKWRVLSIENGCVNLVSEETIGRNGESQYNSGYALKLGRLAGYVYAEDILNEVCRIYGHGKGAKSARSIKVEDVNNLTGYDVEKDSEYKDIYGKTIVWKRNNDNKEYKWKYTCYEYNYNEEGMNLRTESENSIEYKLIFYSDMSNGKTASYWLASKCVKPVESLVSFTVLKVGGNSVYSRTFNYERSDRERGSSNR